MRGVGADLGEDQEDQNKRRENAKKNKVEWLVHVVDNVLKVRE